MPHSTPSRPPPRVLPVTPNPSSLESAALALSPYRSSSVSPSSSGNSTKTVGTASPSPRLQLSPGAGLTGSLAAAESGRVLQGARLGRARWGLLEQAEVALEAVEECRNEVARVREEVEAAVSVAASDVIARVDWVLTQFECFPLREAVLAAHHGQRRVPLARAGHAPRGPRARARHPRWYVHPPQPDNFATPQEW